MRVHVWSMLAVAAALVCAASLAVAQDQAGRSSAARADAGASTGANVAGPQTGTAVPNPAGEPARGNVGGPGIAGGLNTQGNLQAGTSAAAQAGVDRAQPQAGTNLGQGAVSGDMRASAGTNQPGIDTGLGNRMGVPGQLNAGAGMQADAPMGVRPDLNRGDLRGQAGADMRTFRNDQPFGANLQAGTQAGVNIPMRAPFAGAQDDWRYVSHQGQWWFWTPENRWVIFQGGSWVPFNMGIAQQQMYSGPYYSGYPGYGSFSAGYYDGGQANYGGYFSPSYYGSYYGGGYSGWGGHGCGCGW